MFLYDHQIQSIMYKSDKFKELDQRVLIGSKLGQGREPERTEEGHQNQ